MSQSAVFVKAATTTTSPEKSQADIMAMLRRYHASGFGFRRVATKLWVSFHVPRQGDGGDHTVEIPIDTTLVLERLLEVHRLKRSHTKRPDAALAERVAWRILYLWIDAALAAVAIGAQSLEDAFFAHLVMENTDGQTGRVSDYVRTLQQGTGGYQLPAARLLIGSGEPPR